MSAASKKMARSALGAALGFLLLYLSALLPTAGLALLCAASLGVVFVLMSCGWRWALGCYAVTAALSLLLLPSKGGALAYALFAGLYPPVKLWIERRRSRALRWVLKLAYFNAVFAAAFLFLTAMLSPGQDWKLPVWAVFAAANAAFAVYDFALTQAILLYIRKIARRIH